MPQHRTLFKQRPYRAVGPVMRWARRFIGRPDQTDFRFDEPAPLPTQWFHYFMPSYWRLRYLVAKAGGFFGRVRVRLIPFSLFPVVRGVGAASCAV